MITGHVYDNAPKYRIEERQERNEPGPAISSTHTIQQAEAVAKYHADWKQDGLWYVVVDKDSGEVKSATQS